MFSIVHFVLPYLFHICICVLVGLVEIRTPILCIRSLSTRMHTEISAFGKSTVGSLPYRIIATYVTQLGWLGHILTDRWVIKGIPVTKL
jgi:hypothetical protein